MCAKKTDEPVEPTTPAGQVLEATADIFYVTAEGLESHLQIKGSNTLFVIAESQNAIAAITKSGGTARNRANGKKNGQSAASSLPYYTDDQGVKRCNRMTVDGERCGQPVTQREGKFGTFWSCKNYKNHAKGNGNGD